MARRRPLAVAIGLTGLLTVTLAACTSHTDPAGTGDGGKPAAATATGNDGGQSATPSSSAPPAPAAIITASLATARKPASPADPVTVSIKNGTLTDVTLRNPYGKVVRGALSGDRTSWHNAEVLGYDRTYHLTATGKNADGVAVTKRSTITTVRPGVFTMPSISDIYGSGITRGGTYGVGMVVRVNFDEVVNKAAAEKNLKVTTTPSVTGSWYWRDAQNAYWRPKNFYKPGTKVSVDVGTYGKRLGQGLYGQADRSTSFVIGQKRVAIASPKTHRVEVYFDDKHVRSMPTSMGKGGTDPVNPGINFWTMYGTYTVLNHENPAIMSSGSYGVSKSSPNYYPPEPFYYSTKISTDGIYLHENNATSGVQGYQNVSHGCLNLVTSHAKWYYEHSRVGDVVRITRGEGNPEISFDQGGQWEMSWKDWTAGSAQH